MRAARMPLPRSSRSWRRPFPASRTRWYGGSMATTTKRKTKAQSAEDHALSYFKAVTERDVEAMVAHMDDDVIDDITPVGILRGTGEVREFFSELFSAFPDFEFAVEQTCSSPQLVSVQWRATGTFRGAPF